MEFKDYFLGEDLEKAKGVIMRFHDRSFFDKKIKNPSAVLLSTYMMSNKVKKGFVSKEDVKNLFIRMGKKAKEFDKALYEISGKRKGKTSFLDIEKDSIGLNLDGLKKIKEILNLKDG